MMSDVSTPHRTPVIALPDERLFSDYYDVDNSDEWLLNEWVFLRTLSINNNSLVRIFYNMYDFRYHRDEWYSRDWITVTTENSSGSITTSMTRTHIATIYSYDISRLPRSLIRDWAFGYLGFGIWDSVVGIDAPFAEDPDNIAGEGEGEWV